jgi:hypothetical protein
VSIEGTALNAIEIPSWKCQQLWDWIVGMSVPLNLGVWHGGSGGTCHEVEISHGLTRVAAGWWMKPPPDWTEIASIFGVLVDFLPPDVRSRYDWGSPRNKSIHGT